MKTVYYDYFDYDGKLMYVYVSNKGLVFVSSLDKPEEVYNYVPSIIIERNKSKVEFYVSAIKSYLYRANTNFNIKLDLDAGTDFQKRVWNELVKIPYGKTVTYNEIACRIKKPNAARAVSNAIAKNPFIIVVPCHRVIGKNGDLRGYRAGTALKKILLDLESIISKYSYSI